MKKVLILGAGLVVKPMARYLLDNGYFVTIASRTKSKADAILQNHPNSKAVAWTVDQEAELDKMIQEHDLVVSLLPYTYHVMVAKKAIAHHKNMVTTSYVKPEMKALDQQAKDAGIIILNEVGLDPGIDHMSAKKIIDEIHSQGGKIEQFYSLCGALPEISVACQNPFKYKFSWSPIGVLMAGNNDARFKRNGKELYYETKDLFKVRMYVNFPQVGVLEVYPNRDSIPYIDLYEIPEAHTVFRGTLRYPGWCDIVDSMKSLGLFSNKQIDATNMSYAELMAQLIGASSLDHLEDKVANFLKQPIQSLPIRAMNWLGLFSDQKVGMNDTLLNIVGKLMIDKMMLQGDEKDMVVMMHLFKVKYPDGSTKTIRSTLLDFGTPNTDTSVARTVSLPASAAVVMILEGKIKLTGVHIPTLPELYNPILEKLEELGIKMNEQYDLPDSYTFF